MPRNTVDEVTNKDTMEGENSGEGNYVDNATSRKGPGHASEGLTALNVD